MKSKLIKAEKWKTIFVCCPYIFFRREGLKPDIPTDDCSLQKKKCLACHSFVFGTHNPSFTRIPLYRTCGYKCLKTYSYPFVFWTESKKSQVHKLCKATLFSFIVSRTIHMFIST